MSTYKWLQDVSKVNLILQRQEVVVVGFHVVVILESARGAKRGSSQATIDLLQSSYFSIVCSTGFFTKKSS